jgi:hypothetical protein
MVSERGLARYVCTVCHKVTLAEPHLVAVTCSHCGRVDLGTELARAQWRTVAEVRLAQRPEARPVAAHPLTPARLRLLAMVCVALAAVAFGLSVLL